MPRPVLALLALVLALAACERPSPPPAPPAAEPSAPASAGPGVSVDELLVSREEYQDVVARMGEPREMLTEPIGNVHVEGQQDMLRTYVYDGLRVETYEVQGGPVLVREVRATDPAYRTQDGIGPGATRAAIEAAAGPPVEAAIDGTYYELLAFPDDPTPLRVLVVYDGDRAREVVWYPYVD